MLVCLYLPCELLGAHCLLNACRRHLVAFLGCISIMWTELCHSGIFDDVVQWHSLATFLNSLTVFSTCWQYCFPGLPPPSIPMDEYESTQQLPQLDLVCIALQIPLHSMSRSSHTMANRYELHKWRNTAQLLICFLQRLISQNHGYIPPFFEVLHFYKTSLLCDIMRSTFADMRHLRSLRTRFPDLVDFIQDPGHHQQPCVYLRLSPWHSPHYVGATDQDVLRREHSRSRKFLQLLRGHHAFFEPALHYWKRSNTYWLFCAIPFFDLGPGKQVAIHATSASKRSLSAQTSSENWFP